MTIRYTNIRSDLLIANFHALIRNRVALGFWAILIVVFCGLSLKEPTVAEQSLGYKIAFCVLLAVFYLTLTVGATMALTAAMVLLRKNKGVLGEHRITLTAEGLVESTVHNESTFRWSAYHETVSTRRHLLLFVNEGMFLVIPKKRPLLEGDLNAFETALGEMTRKT